MILRLAFSEQRLLDLFQNGIRDIVNIFVAIVWRIFDQLFGVFIRWMGRDAALVLELLIAAGFAFATYIYVRKFVSGGATR